MSKLAATTPVCDRNGSAPPPLVVGAKEAAQLLGIGTRLLWSKTNANEIPHVRIGRRVLYPVAQLEEWLANRAATGKKR